VCKSNDIIAAELKCLLPMPRFAYIANTYGQAERNVWDYFKKYTREIPGCKPNEAKLRLDFAHNGGRIMLLSAENMDTLPGIYLDGVVFDEYGKMNPTVWTKIIRPMLSDRKGWAHFIGTFEGMNHFHKLYQYAKNGADPEWSHHLYKASETGYVDKEELESARRTMSEEEYLEQYECEPAGVRGAYFCRELALAEKEGRIGIVPYEPMLPVDTWWDLGMNDLMAVWFTQSLRGDHRFVDYDEACGLGIPEFVDRVREKIRAGKSTPGSWNFPHDVAVRELSGRTRIEMFESLGCRPNNVIPRCQKKMESINAARVVFKACRFDAARCELGLNALGNYKRQWNDKNQCYSDSPLHNWASNGADAFQQFGMGLREDSRPSNLSEMRDHRGELRAESAYDPFDAWGG
jgi:hypothetical protein